MFQLGRIFHQLLLQLHSNISITLIIVVSKKTHQCACIFRGKIPRCAEHGTTNILYSVLLHVSRRDLGFETQIILFRDKSVRLYHANGSVEASPKASARRVKVLSDALSQLGRGPHIELGIFKLKNINGIVVGEQLPKNFVYKSQEVNKRRAPPSATRRCCCEGCRA